MVLVVELTQSGGIVGLWWGLSGSVESEELRAGVPLGLGWQLGSQAPTLTSPWDLGALLFLFELGLGQVGELVQLLVEGGLALLEQLVLGVDLLFDLGKLLACKEFGYTMTKTNIFNNEVEM